jgi:hypothetical protein
MVKSKIRNALMDAAISLIANGCDALIALDGRGEAKKRAHDMIEWHFEEEKDCGENEESSLSN